MELILLSACVVLLLLLNAIFVACELSLVKVRYGMVSGDSEADRLTAPVMTTVEKHADRVARIIRLGYAVCTIGIGAILYPLLKLATAQHMPGPVLYVVIVALVVLLHYIVSSIIPRAIALARPQNTLSKTFWLVLILGFLSRPFLAIVERVDRTVFKILKIEPEHDLNDFDVEVQLRAIGEEEVEMTHVTRKIMRNTLTMAELEISDILLPRNQVQYFDINDSLEDNLAKARNTGHTRFPLCEGDLDHALGIIHIKDIFRYQGSIESLDLKRMARRIIRIRSEESVESALEKLLRTKMHMALVVDEFGGAVGVVTMESILEELVGDIQDEFDYEDALIQAIGERVFKVSGLAAVHDLEQALGIEVDNDDVSTVGGLITAVLGRIPEKGEKIVMDEPGIEAVIDEVDKRRIIAATIHITQTQEEDSSTDKSSSGTAN